MAAGKFGVRYNLRGARRVSLGRWAPRPPSAHLRPRERVRPFVRPAVRTVAGSLCQARALAAAEARHAACAGPSSRSRRGMGGEGWRAGDPPCASRAGWTIPPPCRECVESARTSERGCRAATGFVSIVGPRIPFVGRRADQPIPLLRARMPEGRSVRGVMGHRTLQEWRTAQLLIGNMGGGRLIEPAVRHTAHGVRPNPWELSRRRCSTVSCGGRAPRAPQYGAIGIVTCRRRTIGIVTCRRHGGTKRRIARCGTLAGDCIRTSLNLSREQLVGHRNRRMITPCWAGCRSPQNHAFVAGLHPRRDACMFCTSAADYLGGATAGS